MISLNVVGPSSNKFVLATPFVMLKAGVLVQLQATFDQTTTPPGSDQLIVNADSPHLVFYSPVNTMIQASNYIVVEPDCNYCGNSNSGAVSFNGASVVYLSGNPNSTVSETVLGAGLNYVSLLGTQVGTVVCNFTLAGDHDELVYYKAPPMLTLTISDPIHFTVTATGGLNTPITAESDSGVTEKAIVPAVGSDSTYQVTVAAPGHSVNVDLTCQNNDQSLVSPAAIPVSFTGSRSFTAETTDSLVFTITAPAIAAVGDRGTMIYCAWNITGLEANRFLAPADLDFYIGGVVNVDGPIATPPGDGNVYAGADGDYGRYNLTVPAMNVTGNGVYFNISCRDSAMNLVNVYSLTQTTDPGDDFSSAWIYYTNGAFPDTYIFISSSTASTVTCIREKEEEGGDR